MSAKRNNLPCSYSKCPKLQWSKGYCQKHYRRNKNGQHMGGRVLPEGRTLCVVETCHRLASKNRRLCGVCKTADAPPVDPTWWRNPETGYVSRFSKGKIIYQHREIMEGFLERPLFPGETVHHIDGITDNNLLNNLQLRNKPHGEGQAYQCQECGSCNVIAVPLLSEMDI